MQESLDSLPKKYRPNFSIMDELQADEFWSRLSEPVITQTLCAALQIVLVNLLSAFGISFSAIVGHSSGETVAAYAAGALPMPDAIRIAYRGWATRQANILEGAMMAAGLSMDEATADCAQGPIQRAG